MKTWNADRCSCCKEIWIREKLKPVSLGTHKLYLCPDCYKEYEKVVSASAKKKRNVRGCRRRGDALNFGAFIKGAEIVCADCEHTNIDCTHCKVMETGLKLADEEMDALIQKRLVEAMRQNLSL